MAKIKTSKKAVISSDNTALNLKNLNTLLPYNPTENLAKQETVIKGIVECIQNNQPQDMIIILETHLLAMGRKKVPKNPDTPVIAPAAAKAIVAGMKAIINILNPRKVAMKQPDKRVRKAVVKRRAPSTSAQRPPSHKAPAGIALKARVSVKKRASKS